MSTPPWRFYVLDDTPMVIDGRPTYYGELRHAQRPPVVGEPVAIRHAAGTTTYSQIRRIEHHAIPTWWHHPAKVTIVLSLTGAGIKVGSVIEATT